MSLPTSHDILQAAADDARQAYIDNLNREPTMRASRAGQPLLFLALEDFVIPRLPKLESNKPANLEKRVSQNISISMGYLFEKALLKGMKEDPAYSTLEVVTQQKFDYKGITGTADMIVIDREHESVQVIECKSLNVEKQREAEETKLSVDNWGYLTQLALYHAAATELFPDLKVKSVWKVYAKKSGMVFTIPLKFQQSIVAKAIKRAEAYNEFKAYWEVGDAQTCTDILLEFRDSVPPKGFYYGRLSASCGFHFNPWSAAVLDEDGLVLSDLESRLKCLLKYAMEPDEDVRSQLERVALRLLDNK